MFSDELRNELAAIAPQSECDRLAQLSGTLHAAGRFRLGAGGAITVGVDVASSAVARRTFALLRSFDVDAVIRTYRQRAFARAMRYQIDVPGSPRAVQVLNEAGVLTARLAPLARPPRRVVARSCCRGAYLRGALLASGSLSGPRSPQLEIRVATVEGALFVAEVAQRAGAPMRVADRGRHAVAYAKGVDAVAGVLASAGASSAVLSLSERAVVGETRARANRLANADHANLVRVSRAAHAQLRALQALTDAGDLASLPDELREVAELRLRYPTLSLRELALRCSPPATKAAVHRRLRKLVRLADV